MTKLRIVLLVLILAQTSMIWAGGIESPKVKKVVIDDTQAAALTNKAELLLHGVRLPQVEFRQANIADILVFLNTANKQFAKTEEAKQISIVVEPDTQKELMKYEDYGNNSGGLVHVSTFNGLDMSVLEVVQMLQTVGNLDRRVEGQKLVLSLKKNEKQVQQVSPGASTNRTEAVVGRPER